MVYLKTADNKRTIDSKARAEKDDEDKNEDTCQLSLVLD